MCSTGRCCGNAAAGFPIRKSSDQRLYTATRGLSQCPTSFIGTWRQGIHRKPLVASPRDAEKLILFGLHVYVVSYYSVGKVLSRRLTGKRCAPQELSRASLTLQHIWLSIYTRRPGSSPGRAYPLRCKPDKTLGQLIDRQTVSLSLSHGCSCSPGGDDGIRTRGLRLAKALLSR